MGRLRFLLASLVLALGSCSPEVPSSTAFADDGPDTLTTANGDVGAPATTDDSSGGDEGTTTGTEPGEGLPGEACTSDADCVDYCDVPDGDSEGVCVEPCFGGTCPEGFVCAEIETGDGPVDVCVEAQDTFCQTCELNADCGDQTDLCVPLAGANYCTISCARDPEVCPPGFTCGLIGSADDGVVLQQCVPNNGVCCVDGDGDVFGEGEGCLGPDCDDENPDVNSSSPEICDGLDNDCDDLVDNDPVDCLAAGCELGTVGYFDYGAEACSDEGCVQSETNLCGLYTCEGGGSLGDVCATACNGEEDTLCVPDAHCDASVCEADYGYGVACDEVSDCASDHCQNGFCCAGGDCCQVDADCPLNPSDVSVCTQPVACQGSRGVTLCGGDFVCSSGGSVDDDSACDAAVEASDCGPYPSVFCNGAVDQQVPTCADSCADDADCDADAYCDTSTNECKADGDDGAPCGTDGECASGHCQNGFCCAGGDCCAAASDCPASYGSDPACDDAANCQGTRDDATCVANVCGTSPDIADDSGCTNAVVANECGAYPSAFCTGGENQNSPVCAQNCSSDADCDPSAYCNVNNVCVLDEPNGDPCGASNQCQSGYCSNGYCCNGGDCCASDSDCGFLDEASVCIDAAGCQGTKVAGVCGNEFACETADTPDDSGCDGTVANNCGLYPPVTCSADPNQVPPDCAISCIDDGDCDPGANCTGGVCVPDAGVGGACGDVTDCAGGLFCVDGVCCGSACDGTCEACDVPGSVGTCTDYAQGTDPESECGAVSCGGYYDGWIGDTCYQEANASDSACNGLGACETAGDVCPGQSAGTSSVTCTGCTSPATGSCTGTTPGSCTNDPLDTVDNCGSCGNTCTNANGTTSCVGGTCSPSCAPGYSDCDGDPTNGCETALNTNSNCGGCGQVCDLANAGETCSSGTCQVTSCTPGYLDCNGQDGDGCEVNSDTSPTNCGSCGNTCTNSNGSTSCSGGECVPNCADGFESCDGDPDNGCETSTKTLTDCGGCNVACSLNNTSTHSCATGNCEIIDCSNGYCDSNGSDADGCETDIDTNPACSNYTSLGTVPGDGNGSTSTSGTGEAWYRVRVEETSSAILPNDLEVNVLLQMPAGADYDLFVRRDSCSGSSTWSSLNGPGSDDSVQTHKDDTAGDNSHYIYINVRVWDVNTCAPFTLTVTGLPSGDESP